MSIRSNIRLEGRPVAKVYQEKICELAQQLFHKYSGLRPGLCVIRVGEIPASLAYIRQKRRAAEICGFVFCEKVLPANCSREALEKTITEANHDEHFHGVIIQLPLPEKLMPCIFSVAFEKNVDGLYDKKLSFIGEEKGYTACTALGVVALLQAYNIGLQGKHVVVVGRSMLVGRPLAALLLDKNATVTMAHSYTHPLEFITRQADIVCVAAGVRGLIKPKHITEGKVVVDIGIHVEPGDPVTGTPNRLYGDVDPDVMVKTSAFSPVPGGVGPMTVACLLYNTLYAAYRSCGDIFPKWI